ncbi:MAG: hypothetical protein ACE5OP_06115 [Candidatus Glassbacteria bacterium]
MRSVLSLEREWFEGLHRECLPAVSTFPEEIRESVSYASRKVANPLFPLMVRWTLEPSGVCQSSIIPLAYSVHLLEASSYVIDQLTLKEGKPRDRRFLKLLSRYGDAICILCVDAMVTMSFQILTDLPKEEFVVISNLLIQRFGADGVLGKKTDGSRSWRGDMFIVACEASARLAGFEAGSRRKILQYARRCSTPYRKLEMLLGEPPGRGLLTGRTNISNLKGVSGSEVIHTVLRELLQASKDLGSVCEDFYRLSEGLVEIFAGLERSLSRLNQKVKTARTKESVR